MVKRLWKYFFYFTAICLIELFPGYVLSASGNEGDDVQLRYPALITAIYQKQPKQRFWQEKSLRDELQKQITLFALAGINDAVTTSYRALKKADEQNNWQRYERLASDLLLFYLSYTEQLPAKGRHWLFGKGMKNNIGAPSKDTIEAFFNAASPQSRLKYLQTLSADTAQSAHLYKNLLELYATKHASAAKFTAFAKTGKELKQKQLLLSRLQISGDISSKIKRYLESEDKKLYSRELQAIIIAFQKRHGLKTDGIIGQKTRFWLNLSPLQRLRLMALNALRVQFWAAQLRTLNKSHLIFINIPDYTMEYWDAGEKLFASKVIVGRTDRKTPLFATKLDAIVFNPEWRVPNSIMRQDILPEVLADKHYLTQHQYEILTSWQSEDVLDPKLIDWSLITAENFPYKLRQKPGKKNALGLYKFNTPNQYAVYLHDTPAKYLFANQTRAYSSGCIRIQKAKQFVQLLMDKSDFSPQDYNQYYKEGKTRVVSLKRIIPVYTLYQTVWADDWGVTQFRKDIYHYDQ